MNRTVARRSPPVRSSVLRLIIDSVIILGATMATLLAPRAAHATFDEFADSFSPKHFQLRTEQMTLTLKGEVELELHDLEGKGGAGYDSPTDTRTLGTRSPFIEIDSFWLALRLSLSPHFAVNSVLEFDQRGARVGAVFLDARGRWPSAVSHHLEVGLHQSLVKIDRRSERYPLIATIYWRQPEVHAVYEGRLTLTPRVSLELGLSLAMMRPISFAGVQDSTAHRGTINVVAYGGARIFSGNSPIGGGRLRLEAYGLFVDGFAFVGRLSAEAGTDELRNSFANYRDLPGFNASDRQQQDRTAYWGGGRVGFDGFGLHLLVEAIASRESLLSRYGAYAQAAYEAQLRAANRLFHRLELLVRGEIYRIRRADRVQASGRALRSPAPSQAITWDYDVLTAALICTVHREVLRLRLEYSWIGEENGVAALLVPNVPLRNNELMAQLELRF
jgi:hypothetical protein